MKLPAPTVADLASALRRGEISSVAATRAALGRIADLNPTVNAFAAVDETGALTAAARADEQLAAGTDRGPLHGVPVSVKDLIDVAGLPTTCGSATSFGVGVAQHDADVVSRLRAAGAVITGKNTLHEFAYGATGDRSVHGASRNPHNLQRMSGGSSGGTAVAVAAGMVALSIGTDTVGSVRVPAALCGVVGFKPAIHALPTGGVHPLAPTLDHVGLIAATVQDIELSYAALRGEPIDAPPSGTPVVGWIDPSQLAVADPVVTARVHRHLAAADVITRPVTGLIDNRDEISGMAATLQRMEAFRVHRHHLERDRDLIDPEVLARLESGRAVTTTEYEAADRARHEFRHRLNEILDTHDLLALPTTPITAPRIGERTIDIAGTPSEVRAALLSLTGPWNLAGVPAITVPTDPDPDDRADSMPAGIQLVTRPGREAALFALARRLQNAPDATRPPHTIARSEP